MLSVIGEIVLIILSLICGASLSSMLKSTTHLRRLLNSSAEIITAHLRDFDRSQSTYPATQQMTKQLVDKAGANYAYPLMLMNHLTAHNTAKKKTIGGLLFLAAIILLFSYLLAPWALVTNFLFIVLLLLTPITSSALSYNVDTMMNVFLTIHDWTLADADSCRIFCTEEHPWLTNLYNAYLAMMQPQTTQGINYEGV